MASKKKKKSYQLGLDEFLEGGDILLIGVAPHVVLLPDRAEEFKAHALLGGTLLGGRQEHHAIRHPDVEPVPARTKEFDGVR
jgi:hypothetical protein